MKKGVAPAVSYVLLVVVGVTVAVMAFIWAQYEISKLKESPIAPNVEAQMITIDNEVRRVSRGDTNFTTTIPLYYSKGFMQVDEEKNWIKFTANLNTIAYQGEITATGLGTTCNSSTNLIQDPETTIKMSRISGTNVFRGGSGSFGGSSQRIEIVACFNDIQIEMDEYCAGRSGPRAWMTVKRIGYNSTSNKPIVQVGIC